jgi:uncharacterized protein (TIGR03435 family)
VRNLGAVPGVNKGIGRVKGSEPTMSRTLSAFSFFVCLAVAAIGQTAPTKPAFEVASIKPSAPLDMAKMAAGIQAGQMPRLGAHVDPARAEYLYMTLKQLIANAYNVKPYQVTGPDWLDSERFDIEAKIPDGVAEGNAPLMLQTLLEDRFKLTAHRETKDRPVLALIVGKNGPKMQEATEIPQAFDPNAPPKPGEMQMDTPDGPARMSIGQNGQATVNLGARGVITYQMNPTTMAMQMNAHSITMAGLADMLSQFAQVGGSGRQVVDLTGLKGNYQLTLDFPMADLMNLARASGMTPPPGAASPQTEGAPEPSGTSSLSESVQALGLKLDPRNAPVEDVVVDHVEKTPAEN